jgi:hypothetical protein
MDGNTADCTTLVNERSSRDFLEAVQAFFN